MKNLNFIFFILLSMYCLNLQGQINVNCDGKVAIGSNPIYDAGLNISPTYSAPGATNFGIGYWTSGNAVISLGVQTSYAWMQSWNGKPLQINQEGNNVFFGSSSLEGVGIGNGLSSLSAKLHVVGNIYATGSITSSDSRFKSNIEAIDLKGRNYKDLEAVTYNYNVREKGLTLESLDTSKVAKMDKEFYKRKHFGFIAQEVKEIFPELVYEDNDGYLAIDYQAFIPILFELVKEQKTTIENLKNEIEIIKSDCCSNVKLKNASLSGTEDITGIKTVLYQNSPNPFSKNTQIKYFLADDAINASIYIYNMNGIQLKNYTLQNKGAGEIILDGSEFNAGVYLYSLVVNNKEVDIKRMILTN